MSDDDRDSMLSIALFNFCWIFLRESNMLKGERELFVEIDEELDRIPIEGGIEVLSLDDEKV